MPREPLITPPAAQPRIVRGRFLGRVLRNDLLCPEHYYLTLVVRDFPASVPGQFIQLSCTPNDDFGREGGISSRHDATAQRASAGGVDFSADTPRELEWRVGGGVELRNDPDLARARAFLRRPFSLAGRRELLPPPPHAAAVVAAKGGGETELDIIYRVYGKGTRHLETLRAGDEVSLLGPLGHGFVIPKDLGLGLLVGGGVGIPPMFYLAEALHAAGKKGLAFIGAQRRTLLPVALDTGIAPTHTGTPNACTTDFARYGFASVITTDDGSVGMKGFVPEALDRYLAEALEHLPQEKIVVYCCGPTPMMRATAAVAAKHAVVCQVSLEQPMACGMGTCQSCVIRWRPKPEAAALQVVHGTTAEGTGWVYKLTCTDGPVFDVREIVWEK